MKRALLVIDVQNEYFTGRMPVTYPKDSFENILKAIDTADQNEIPIIYIQHTATQTGAQSFVKESKAWELHPELLNRRYDLLIEKHLPGSFTGTGLEVYLRTNKIDTVAICGYMTQMCCDTTARQALHIGFAVDFLDDATGTLNISNYAGQISAEDLHKSVLITQAMRFSKVMSTTEWIKAL